MSEHPRTNLERKEGRGRSTCLVLTVALPLTEQPRTPTLGPIPSFFFFYANTCPRCLDPVAAGNQTAEWAKETTPCVWAAPGKAVNSHSEPAASRQGRVLASPAHPDPSSSSSHRQTLLSRHLVTEDEEWHSSMKTGAWDSCVTVQRFETRGKFLLVLSPRKKTGVPPYITGLERKSRAPMKPGLSPWTTYCVRKGAFKLSSAPVYTGQSACHRDRMLTITLLNSFLLAFHMPHKILVLLAFPYWNCTLNKDLLSC